MRKAILSLGLLLSLMWGLNTSAITQATTNDTSYVFIPLVMKTEPPPPPPTFENQVLALVNQQRAQNGCNVALTIDSRLQTAAYLHSQDMAINNFFSHTGSNGSTAGERITAQGYRYSAVAENIAAGYTTPQEVVAGWMNSSGHRANILNCSYVHTGIGYYYQSIDQGNVCDATDCNNGPFFHYWTQDFAKP